MTFFHCYKPHRFNAAAQDTIEKANSVISEMRAEGYILTLRQLYYQFVRRNWIENTEKQYKRLGRTVTSAREAGIMDWLAIEDRGRTCYGPTSEEDPANVINGVEFGLRYDQWARQDHYLEVWVEKQALEGVIARPCNRFDVRYMACKGYLSASEAWRAGLRFQKALEDGKICHLIHLADHDPSGLDMTKDNANRLRLFAESHKAHVRRIALNMEQVDHYNPPPNPAKTTDSRFKAYTDLYGPESWELDALEPSVLDKLITDTINEYRDPNIWDDVLARQEDARAPLAALSEHWGTVQQFLYDNDLV